MHLNLHHDHPGVPVVLVVDDDPGIRTFMSHALRDAGYNVRTAMDVFDGVECLRHKAVAAVVVDMLFVNSDGRSGLDLLRFIRGNPRLRTLPVVVLTGFSLNRTVTDEVAALGAELWHKPFDPVDLVQRIHQLVPQNPISA
jgi:CheY-like chemotaxis protein